MTSSNIAWAIQSISNSRTIWDPHVGCAVLAGCALLDKELVEHDARPYVQALVDSIVEDHAPSESAPLDFDPSLTRDKVVSLLSKEDDHVRQLGHDWIYAGYVLSATADNPELGRPPLWASVAHLLAALRKSGPGWITINGKNTVVPVPIGGGKSEPSICAPEEILKTFAGFDRSARAEEGDQQLGHLLTHGHAIQRLNRLGYAELACAASSALRARIDVLRHAATLEEKTVPFAPLCLNPAESVFWKQAAENWSGGHYHLLKFAYSFLELRRGSSLPEAETSSAFCRILCSLKTQKADRA